MCSLQSQSAGMGSTVSSAVKDFTKLEFGGREADGDAERRVKDPSPKDVNGNECNFRRKLSLPPFASLPPAVASARMPNLYLCMDVYIIE